jgi:hypothetical protein
MDIAADDWPAAMLRSGSGGSKATLHLVAGAGWSTALPAAGDAASGPCGVGRSGSTVPGDSGGGSGGGLGAPATSVSERQRRQRRQWRRGGRRRRDRVSRTVSALAGGSSVRAGPGAASARSRSRARRGSPSPARSATEWRPRGRELRSDRPGVGDGAAASAGAAGGRAGPVSSGCPSAASNCRRISSADWLGASGVGLMSSVGVSTRSGASGRRRCVDNGPDWSRIGAGLSRRRVRGRRRRWRSVRRRRPLGDTVD